MSVFFPPKTRAPVSYLLLEAMGRYAEMNPEASMAQALAAGLSTCGFKPTEFTEKEVQVIVTRIQEIQGTEEEVAPTGMEPVEDKDVHVGTDFLNTIAKMPMDQKCLVAVGFDLGKAKTLYCEIDKEECDRIVSAAIEVKWKELKTIFESVIVGMGGQLTDPDVIDANSPEGLAALKSLGF